MKKALNLRNVIIGFLAAALGISLFQIHDLKQDIRSLKLESQSQYSGLRDQIRDLSSSLEALINDQASILADAGFEMGEFDPDTMTCSVDFTIVPKELTEDMTVTVSMGDSAAELTRDGNRFRGTVMLGLFQGEENRPTVLITSGGTTRTEISDLWIEAPWRKVLPRMNGDISYSATRSGDSLEVFGELTVFFDPVMLLSGATFERFEIVTFRNGAEYTREDMTTEILALEELGSGSYRGELNRQYQLADDETLELYLCATDSLGFVHLDLLLDWHTEDGSSATAVWSGEEIYDAEGNLLARG